MNKRKRGGRGLTLILIMICLAIGAAIVWGIVAGIGKIMDYGNHATISSESEAEVPGESMDNTLETNPEEIPVESLPKNTYATDGFYERDGLKCYYSAGVRGVPGIDVSSYQGDIDWKAVKEAGVEFAMIRVGYRGYVTGELDLDDCFEDNIQGALDAGIQVGVYFFSQALNEEEAVEEAEFVLAQIQDYDVSYPVVFDWEEMETQARTDEMNMLYLTSCALAFCQTVEEAGYTAGVYFNQVYGYQQLNLPSIQDYIFWLAQYEDAPTFVYDFQMWQYTNEGTVPGIEGPVDMNISFYRE